MSETPERRVVDVATGESWGVEEFLRPLNDQIAGLERDMRGWRARYAELRRDKVQEAQKHPLWPVAQKLFERWQEKCNHRRSGWSADRFWLILPLLENKQYGEKVCARAIDGAAFDPFTTKRRNGSVKKHDDWELVFRNAGKLEEFANRAPLDWSYEADEVEAEQKGETR